MPIRAAAASTPRASRARSFSPSQIPIHTTRAARALGNAPNPPICASNGSVFASRIDDFISIREAERRQEEPGASNSRARVWTNVDATLVGGETSFSFSPAPPLFLSGDLSVDDLEAAWNERFAADFGFAVDKPSDGVLQDVHWSAGLFGYFPTYSLGNVYAGCLHKALRQAVPDLDAQMAEGDLSAATGWLRETVQRHGGLYHPRDVIERACGTAPSEAPLLEYLEAKFGALYDL